MSATALSISWRQLRLLDCQHKFSARKGRRVRRLSRGEKSATACQAQREVRTRAFGVALIRCVSDIKCLQKKHSELVVGIDLGTTNSAVAVRFLLYWWDHMDNQRVQAFKRNGACRGLEAENL